MTKNKKMIIIGAIAGAVLVVGIIIAVILIISATKVDTSANLAFPDAYEPDKTYEITSSDAKIATGVIEGEPGNKTIKVHFGDYGSAELTFKDDSGAMHIYIAEYNKGGEPTLKVKAAEE